MNIAGLDRARILAALWNASTGNFDRLREAGLDVPRPPPLSLERAQSLLELLALNPAMTFTHHDVRVVHVDLGADELDTRLYNRDNGEGAAERAIRAAFPEVDWQAREGAKP